jgi:tetratricopeptide (TPR) repeat protein
VPLGYAEVAPEATAVPAQAQAPAEIQAPAQTRAPAGRARTEPRVRESTARRACQGKGDPQALSGRAALDRGWCLMDLDRPLEAVPAFERAMSAASADVRRDAAYGQSLAYLKVDLVDKAAVAATREPQPQARRIELQTALLTAQAVNALDAKRPVETLMALDQRSRLAPDRVDLLILRGYAYLDLGRLSDAEKVFAAAAKAGSREGVRGVNIVRTANRTFVPAD